MLQVINIVVGRNIWDANEKYGSGTKLLYNM